MKEILDCKTGLIIKTNGIFEKYSQDELKILRPKLQEAYKNRIPPIYKCYDCLELLRLRGGKAVNEDKKYNTRLHFAHYNDIKGVDCSLKTGISQLSVLEINRKKYRGQQEGEEHKKLKNLIAEYLNNDNPQNGGVSNIIIDKNWKGQNDERFNYKRPDVRCTYGGKTVIFEIQLSTTYLSVIEERQWFYKNNKAFILWIFNQFNDNDDTRRFTDNDIIFSNNLNAFVLDEEAVLKSKENNMLTFKCYFRTFDIVEEKLISSWSMQWVSGLQSLTFDLENDKVFLVDVSSEKIRAEKRLQEIRYDREKESDRINKVTNDQIKLRKLLDKEETIKGRIEDIEKRQKNLINLQTIQRKKHEVIEYAWSYLNCKNPKVPAEELLLSIFTPMFLRLKDIYDSNYLESKSILVKEQIANYIQNFIEYEIKHLSSKNNDLDKELKNLNTNNEKLARLNHKL